ncbi:MAG: hypothetical protein WA874_15300 [Chryseosolibacter sp.]
MNCFIFILAFVFLQDIPFKPKEHFEVKLDYQFKSRPQEDHNTVELGARKDYQRTGATVLPYLVLNIRLLQLPEDKMRLRITSNRDPKPVFRKISINTKIELDLGFTDDMKDRVTAHEYELTFVNAEKTPVDRIQITVDEDGSFIVNGEKRGKF